MNTQLNADVCAILREVRAIPREGERAKSIRRLDRFVSSVWSAPDVGRRGVVNGAWWDFGAAHPQWLEEAEAA